MDGVSSRTATGSKMLVGKYLIFALLVTAATASYWSCLFDSGVGS